MRHDGRAGGQTVGQVDKFEPGGHPDHDLFGKTGEMGRGNGGSTQCFQSEISVRHAVEGIAGWPVKAQRFGGLFPVDGERGSRQCGGAQRTFVEPLACVGEPPPVAGQHFHVSQAVMAEGHGLRGLQMGETGHDCVCMTLRLPQKGKLQCLHLVIEMVNCVANVELEVGRHLIVA